MIRVAVLGAGRIGKIHARNVARNPRCKLVAVADPIAEAARQLAERPRLRGLDATPRRTAERKDVDALIIGTPTDTHVDFLLLGARGGKAVLCEKPVDLDIKRAEAAADRVGAHRRPGDGRLQSPVRSERPGAQAPDRRRSDRRGAPGHHHQPRSGAAAGLLPRDIGRRVPRHGHPRFRHGPVPARRGTRSRSWRWRARSTEPQVREAGDFDTLMVIMRTATGKQCHINCYRKAVYGYDQRFEIIGAEGHAEERQPAADHGAPLRGRRKPKSRIRSSTSFSSATSMPTASNSNTSSQAVERGSAMPVTVRDGCKALRLADAAVESVDDREGGQGPVMRDIGVGIIGTGFMGKAHGLRLSRGGRRSFRSSSIPCSRSSPTTTQKRAGARHAQLGFKRVTTDWQELVADPAVEIVSITAPNVVHKEMALAALARRQTCPLREADRAQRR